MRTKAAELKQELIRQTLEDVGSWSKAVDFEWRRDHADAASFPQFFRTPPPSEDEVRRYREIVRTEYYEWVEPAFEGHLSTDPDAFNPMIEALRTIESMFGGSQDHAHNFTSTSPALIRINDVRVEMGYWQG